LEEVVERKRVKDAKKADGKATGKGKGRRGKKQAEEDEESSGLSELEGSGDEDAADGGT